MELYEREFLLSKILFGSIAVDINDDLILYVNPLTIKQNLFAQRVFKKSYEEALFSGVFTRKEMLQLMEDQGVWSGEKEEEIKKNQKTIEDLKLQVYDNFLRPSVREGIRGELRGAEKEQLNLYEQKHQNDHLDCEGIATYSRLIWVIENTTTHEDGTPYSFDEISITSVLKRTTKERILTEEYREIARNDPWRTLWNNSGQDAEKAFKRSAFDLTKEQSELAAWARLYDNVGEAHEAPPDAIIEDDDALDGWLIKQRREREREQNKYKQDGLEEKHPNADEIFVVANSKEEVKEIYDLNDPMTKMMMSNRMAKVKESNKPVDYHKFKDVQIRAMNEANAKHG